MKHFFIALLIALVMSNFALAEESAEVVEPVVEVVEDVTDWVEVGNQYGEMVAGFIAGTARELGVAVNEFAMSPVGLLSVALVVGHFAGDMILGLLLSGVWFATTLSLWLFIFFKIGYPVKKWTDINVAKRGKQLVKSYPVRELTRRPGIQATLTLFLSFILIVGLILLP
jgi:hypothetical protein